MPLRNESPLEGNSSNDLTPGNGPGLQVSMFRDNLGSCGGGQEKTTESPLVFNPFLIQYRYKRSGQGNSNYGAQVLKKNRINLVDSVNFRGSGHCGTGHHGDNLSLR